MSSCRVPVIIIKLELSQQIFGKHSHIKFHENPSHSGQTVARGWTDKQTDMMKLIIKWLWYPLVSNSHLHTNPSVFTTLGMKDMTVEQSNHNNIKSSSFTMQANSINGQFGYQNPL